MRMFGRSGRRLMNWGDFGGGGRLPLRGYLLRKYAATPSTNFIKYRLYTNNVFCGGMI